MRYCKNNNGEMEIRKRVLDDWIPAFAGMTGKL